MFFFESSLENWNDLIFSNSPQHSNIILKRFGEGNELKKKEKEN